MKIWKFNLVATDSQTVEMPKGANVLSVGAQDPTGATVQLWAEVDPGELPEGRHFFIAGTGHSKPNGDFIGTVITAGGALVWHIYEARVVPSSSTSGQGRGTDS